MKKSKAKNQKSNGVPHPQAKRSGKRAYKKSSVLGRLGGKFERASELAEQALHRLQVWEHASDPRVLKAINEARTIIGAASGAASAIADLEATNWSPPKRSLVVRFEYGETVRIADAYRQRYLKYYSLAVIDNLVVVGMFEPRGVIVRSGSLSPFNVPKSHLERRDVEGQNQEHKSADARR